MGKEMTVGEHIGKNVRDLRQAAGLTQGDLADAMAAVGLAWHRGLVADVETGTRELSVSELVTLAAYFEIPIALLASELAASGDVHDVIVGDRRVSSTGWMNLWREVRDQNSPAGPLIRKAIDAIVGSLHRPWATIWRKRRGDAGTAYNEAWEEITATRPPQGPTFVPTKGQVERSGLRGPWRQSIKVVLEPGSPNAARDEVERALLEGLAADGHARRVTPQTAYKLRRKKERGS